MNRKAKIFTPKSMAIGTLAVAATAFSAVIMSPLSAKAQNSPVSPAATTVDPVDFGFNLGGTETSSEETTTSTTETTTTTTTEGETTTTTTTTTTETSSTTETTSSQETTESTTTEVATDTSTTDSTNILEEITNVSTGVEAQTGVTTEQTTTSTQETVAIVLSVSEQYANATGIEFLFISDLASELGVAGDFLVGTLVFENVRGLRGNRQAALVAFRNALRKAGVFTSDAFNNQAFAEFFTSYATAEEVAAAFNGLSEVRILFLSRASRFFAAKGLRFRLFRVTNISFAQFFVYKTTGFRAITFPPARSSNDD
jgi:hypothetical protein